jgi:hypothetical protein
MEAATVADTNTTTTTTNTNTSNTKKNAFSNELDQDEIAPKQTNRKRREVIETFSHLFSNNKHIMRVSVFSIL